jgi:hypothetical protein
MADAERAVQVAPEHYDFERYDDRERWMSYWHQIRAVLAVRPRTASTTSRISRASTRRCLKG